MHGAQRVQGSRAPECRAQGYREYRGAGLLSAGRSESAGGAGLRGA